MEKMHFGHFMSINIAFWSFCQLLNGSQENLSKYIYSWAYGSQNRFQDKEKIKNQIIFSQIIFSCLVDKARTGEILYAYCTYTKLDDIGHLVDVIMNEEKVNNNNWKS